MTQPTVSKQYQSTEGRQVQRIGYNPTRSIPPCSQ